MNGMNVRVELELESLPTEADLENASASAAHLTNDQMSVAEPRYTRKQGQYLAFIYYYTKLNGRPPAEADMQRHFGTTPPTVHNMIIQLEKKGFITRKPNQPRSIKLLLTRKQLPDLE